MLNLKLAEYKDGKFERFLEFKDFMLSENYIVNVKELNRVNHSHSSSNYHYSFFQYDKDEKDPLNRFNGRTYGDGRFVLVESKIIDRFGKKILMSQDDIFSYNKYIQKACDFINFHHWQETEDKLEMNPNFKILGNLHENPELWEKVKCL